MTGNDLVLNHPTVSRTQAGIKDVQSEFWIFNLSTANGTFLNGELIDSAPLADGDIIQIGPFVLTTGYSGAELKISVEMSVAPLPIEALSPVTGSAESDKLPDDKEKTVRLDLAALIQRTKATPRGTRRLTGTGMLTSRLTRTAEHALSVFWDKRKREAGKMTPDSPLIPQRGHRFGKAQYNWRPTLDLKRTWRPSVFVWALLAAAGLSVVALGFYMDAFSPGDVSAAHVRTTLQPAVAGQPIARAANATSCSNCHSLRTSVETNCANCHTTVAFAPLISDVHERAGITCSTCHAEHKGRDADLRHMANAACIGCHSESTGYVSPISGQRLMTPHGGTVGYPVEGNVWKMGPIAAERWRLKELPGSASNFTIREQFHLVHLSGRKRGEALCSDCHTEGLESSLLNRGVRESCVQCHSVKSTGVGLKREGPDCASCHAQHGESRNLKASRRRSVD